MAKKTVKFDPADDLMVSEVGPWATEKHERLRKYIDASRGARARFLPPSGMGGASYIELYSGPGRSLITDTTEIIDGSAVVAFKAGRDSGHPFSEIHLSDLEAQNSSALAQRMGAQFESGRCAGQLRKQRAMMDPEGSALHTPRRSLVI